MSQLLAKARQKGKDWQGYLKIGWPIWIPQLNGLAIANQMLSKEPRRLLEPPNYRRGSQSKHFFQIEVPDQQAD